MAKKKSDKYYKDKFNELSYEEQLILKNICTAYLCEFDEDLKKQEIDYDYSDYEGILDLLVYQGMKEKDINNKVISKCIELLRYFENPKSNENNSHFIEHVVSSRFVSIDNLEEFIAVSKIDYIQLKLEILLDEIGEDNKKVRNKESNYLGKILGIEAEIAEDLIEIFRFNKNGKIIEDHLKSELKMEEKVVFDIIEKLKKSNIQKLYQEFIGAFLEKTYEELYLIKAKESLEEIIQSGNLEKSEMGNYYLYRAGNSNDGSIISVNPESRRNVFIHIQHGTTKNKKFQSPFISTTSSYMVMATYIYSYQNEIKGERAMPMAIDLTKLLDVINNRIKELEDMKNFTQEIKFLNEICNCGMPEINGVNIQEAVSKFLQSVENEVPIYIRDKTISEDIIDMSTEKLVEERRISEGNFIKKSEHAFRSEKDNVDKGGRYVKYIGKKGTNDTVKSYANTSREFLIKGAIPESAIIKIDQLSLDIMQGLRRKEKNAIKIVDAIKENNLSITNFVSTIIKEEGKEKLGFTDDELYFFMYYYIGNEPVYKIFNNAYKVSSEYNDKMQEYCGFVDDENKEKLETELENESLIIYEQSMRNAILTKVLTNEKVKNLLEENKIVVEGNIESVLSHNIERTSRNYGKMSLIEKKLILYDEKRREGVKILQKNKRKLKGCHAYLDVNGKNERRDGELSIQMQKGLVDIIQKGTIWEKAEKMEPIITEVNLKLIKNEEGRYTASVAAEDCIKIINQLEKNSNEKTNQSLEESR